MGIKGFCIILAFAICTITPDSALAGICEYNLLGKPPAKSVHQSFIKLLEKKKLISQLDPRLGKRDLLRPDGGLCTTTCAANILYATAKYLGYDTAYFKKNSDQIIQDLLSRTLATHSKDGRYGLDFDYLGNPLLETARKLGIRLKITTMPREREHGYHSGNFILDNNTFVIAKVSSSPGQTHAIIPLQIDPSQHQISYFDPNRPDIEFVSQYSDIILNGYPTIQLGLSHVYADHPFQGIIMHLIYIEVLK